MRTFTLAFLYPGRYLSLPSMFVEEMREKADRDGSQVCLPWYILPPSGSQSQPPSRTVLASCSSPSCLWPFVSSWRTTSTRRKKRDTRPLHGEPGWPGICTGGWLSGFSSLSQSSLSPLYTVDVGPLSCCGLGSAVPSLVVLFALFLTGLFLSFPGGTKHRSNSLRIHGLF